MPTPKTLVALLPLLAIPLLAQPQIGGGACTSATLSGTYSLSLTGRDVGASATVSAVSLGVGTVTFDGLSKITIALTQNTIKSTALATNLSGTYSLQANCQGTVAITTGDVANFTLESYNQGKAYLITGADTLFSFSGSGSTMSTATCSASTLNGTYSFNGNGFSIVSGGVAGVIDFSGLMTFDGKNVISGNGFYSLGGKTTAITTTGTYTVTAACTGTASMTDPAGNAITIQFIIPSATGANFILSGASPQMIYTASGRTL